MSIEEDIKENEEDDDNDEAYALVDLHWLICWHQQERLENGHGLEVWSGSWCLLGLYRGLTNRNRDLMLDLCPQQCIDAGDDRPNSLQLQIELNLVFEQPRLNERIILR